MAAVLHTGCQCEGMFLSPGLVPLARVSAEVLLHTLGHQVGTAGPRVGSLEAVAYSHTHLTRYILAERAAEFQKAYHEAGEKMKELIGEPGFAPEVRARVGRLHTLLPQVWGWLLACLQRRGRAWAGCLLACFRQQRGAETAELQRWPGAVATGAAPSVAACCCPCSLARLGTQRRAD